MPCSVQVGVERPPGGKRRPVAASTSSTMKQTQGSYKAIYCSDGWLEIREDQNVEGWISTDSPVPVTT